MPESKSGALPLGDIPILKQRPLAGHTEHYSMDKQNLQEYFVVFRVNSLLSKLMIKDTCRQKKSPDSSVEGLMFALPTFTVRGSDASAACGGSSELSEWQRSAKTSLLRQAQFSPGTATGNLSIAVKKHAGGMF